MERKITVACDGAADLGDLFAERNIPYEPLTVILGEREGLDGKEITPDDIYEYYAKTKKTPKTSAVPPERYAALFEKYTADGGELIYICAASTKSSCYNNAVHAAENFNGVYVIDSCSLSAGIGLLALYADDLVKTGEYTAKEIVEKVEERKNDVDLSLIVDTMTFLYKGGRCSGVAALIASVLKIHISLYMHDGGELSIRKKYIGSSAKAMEKYARDAAEHNPIDPKYVFIVHTRPDRRILDNARAAVLEKCPEANIIEVEAGATITSHTGKGAFAIIYLKRHHF